MDTFKKNRSHPYVLDHKPGFFLGWLLYRLFRRVRFNEEMKDDLKMMRKEGTVVYANKYRGQLDYLLYHYVFRRSRLPYPKIAFDLNISLLLPLKQVLKVIMAQLSSLLRHGRLPNPYQSGFYSMAIEQGTASLIFLVDPKGFIRRFVHAEKDQLHFLLETQKDMDRPIFIVPQLIMYKMTPEKDYSSLADIFFGYKDHPGIIRKIVLFFRYHRRAFIDFGRPFDLKAYLENQAPERPLSDMAVEIRQMLIESIDRQKRIILGPIMKSKQQLKEIVLMDEGVRKETERTASGNGKKQLRQARRKAGEYFDEIAADLNIAYVQSFHIALGYLWKKIFEGIDVDMQGLARVREWARRGPLIYVPSHKSHIDYLILNDVLHGYHMHIPRIAAGRNLAFWPMGYVFRKCGAFFVRRSLKGAKLYSEVLRRYIKALLEEGHPIEFFIEGGRSRNGKLVLPKLGFLALLLNAYRDGYCDDLIFVPTSIVYDRIVEEKSYRAEIAGGVKKQESLKQIIRARHFLKRRYGKIYLQFNEPFSLNEYLAGKDQSVSRARRNLAFHLIRCINEVSLVTPLSLIATAILAKHRRGFLLSEIADTVNILLSCLKRNDVPLAATLADPQKVVGETLSLLIGWKVVDFLEDVEKKEEIFYYVDEEKKAALEYYKNNIIHFFVPEAFISTSLLTGTEEVKDVESIFSDYAFFKNLFQNEFVFDENEDIEGKVRQVIDYFVDSAFLTPVEGDIGYKITKLGFDKLPIWSALAKTFLESYWIAAKSISQRETKKGEKEDILKNMDYLGNRFHKLGLIDHIGALSRINCENALNFINQNILNSSKNSEEARSKAFEKLSDLGQRLYELSHHRS